MDIVGAQVQLRKQGQNYIGLCPFHEERSPSFSVSAEKRFYYCFGCHAGGDVFSFIMRHHGLDFKDATRLLGDKTGIAVDAPSPEEKARQQKQNKLKRVNAICAAFFQATLLSPAGSVARQYLNGRQIGQGTAKKWMLGCGGPQGALLQHLQHKKVPMQLVQEAGLLTEDHKRSLFDERLIIPIHNSQGDIAGFGGRRIVGGQSAKYLNSREGPLFNKSRILFGWHHAENSMRKKKHSIVVEGFMDVIACHRAGVESAIATLGTALTNHHVKSISRLAQSTTLLFDADRAGRQAAVEATAKLVHLGIRTLVAPLKEGEDPDSTFRTQGADALKERVEGAIPAIEHFIATTIDDKMSIEQRAASSEALAPLILSLKSGLERDMYLARLAERVGVNAEQMTSHLLAAHEKQRKKEAKKQTQNKPTAEALPTQETTQGPNNFELAALAELLLFPELRPRYTEVAEFTGDAMRALLDALAEHDESKTTLEQLLKGHGIGAHWQTKLLEIEPRKTDSAEAQRQAAAMTLHTVLNRFKERLVDTMRQEVNSAIALAEGRGEDITDLLRKSQDLRHRKDELRRLQTTPPH